MLPTTRKEKSITSRVDCYGDFSGYYYKEKLDGRDTKCFCLNIVLSEKIIATTDISLVKEYNLPEPSQSFIQKYIEEYNRGNIITDVLVEYLENYTLEYYESAIENKRLAQKTNIKETLKVNPKDNTITIKKAKDSYTREEVIDLIIRAVGESHDWSIENNDIHSIGIIEKRFLSKWLEENL